MTTIVHLRLSGEGVACRGAFEGLPLLECMMEPVVAASGVGLRVTGPDDSAVEEALGADPTVAHHERIAAGGDSSLYEVEFAGAFDDLFGFVADRGGAVLAADGREGVWTVHLRFACREDVREAYARLTERDIDCEVIRLSDSTAGHGSSGLTAEQYEALAVAIDRGYFEIPRRVSLAELADELGISHQALSERFRRAYRTLVSFELAVDATKPA